MSNETSYRKKLLETKYIKIIPINTGCLYEILFWANFISNEMKYFQSDVFYEFPVTVYMKYPEKPIAGLFQCFYFDRNEISSADKYYVNTNPKWSHPNETSAHASVS